MKTATVTTMMLPSLSVRNRLSGPIAAPGVARDRLSAGPVDSEEAPGGVLVLAERSITVN